MAPQQDGWPLGLRAGNVTTGLGRLGGYSSSALFSTSSSFFNNSSSDLDTEATTSIFQDENTSLGSLIPIPSNQQPPRRSRRGKLTKLPKQDKKSCKSKAWFFTLCSKLRTDAVKINDNATSLGHFLQAERQAASFYRSNHQGPRKHTCFPDFTQYSLPALDVNSLLAPRNIESPPPNDDYAAPLLLSCLCGEISH